MYIQLKSVNEFIRAFVYQVFSLSKNTKSKKIATLKTWTQILILSSDTDNTFKC